MPRKHLEKTVTVHVPISLAPCLMALAWLIVELVK